MPITFTPDGLPYYHYKVKNSPYFKHIARCMELDLFKKVPKDWEPK